MSHGERGLLRDFSDVDGADSAELIDRLDIARANDFIRNLKRETFELMAAGPGKRLADIGCGTGDDVRALADIVGETGHVVGFDISEAMLDEARKRHGGAKLPISFEQSSADRLDAPDDAFDAVRSERVYVHLADPLAALKEAVRVIRPGGRVVVSEPDMASYWNASELPQISWKMAEGIRESVVGGWVPRNLYHLFRDAGLVEVQLLIRSVALTDPQILENVFNFPAVADALIANGRMTKDEAEAWFAEHEARKRDDRFLGGMPFFVVAGQKPV